VFKDASHYPAVLAASLAELQHAVVDVVSRPLVVLVGSQVQLGHFEDAEVASAHRQSFLQTVTRLDTHRANFESSSASKGQFTSLKCILN